MITREEKNKDIQDEIFKEENRKKFKKISKIILITITTITLIILYGLYIGAKVTIVKEYKIEGNISNSFHGTKIVHISDILYDSLNKNDLKKIKDQVNEINPDIIIFTGNIKLKDKLDKDEIDYLTNFFKDLKAKLNKYAVSGNNDDNSFDVIMENSNFNILNNKNTLLYYKDINPIEIIGFNTNDIKYDGINPSDNYKICIFSNPDKIDDILEHVSCNLSLASETLGGEIKLFGYPILDNHKYNNDYQKVKDTDLYISNGLGNLSTVRYFNRPSISLFRLTRS